MADGIEYREVVPLLTDEPHPAVARYERVARSGAFPRHGPFVDDGRLGGGAGLLLGRDRGGQGERDAGRAQETGDHRELR